LYWIVRYMAVRTLFLFMKAKW